MPRLWLLLLLNLVALLTDVRLTVDSDGFPGASR